MGWQDAPIVDEATRPSWKDAEIVGDGTPVENPSVFDQLNDGAGQRAFDAISMAPEDVERMRRLDAQGSVAGAISQFSDSALVGFGDEFSAGLSAVLTDREGSLSERYDRNLNRIRNRQEVFQEDRPGLAAGARIAGAVASPAAKVLGPVRTVRGAAAAGGAFAGAEGFAEGEGGAKERLIDGAKAAPAGLLFAGLTSSLVQGGSKGIQRVFSRAEKRPSVENLRAAKNAAYNEVRKSGVTFSQDDTLAAFNRLSRKAKTARWDLDSVSETDKFAFDALRTLERRAELGRPISLNNLDKTRQKLWDIYGKSDHPFVLEAIGEIDDMIAAKADGNATMRAARAANSRFSKAQVLNDAFNKAKRQTAATGSGGNILNKYRQAVNKIIDGKEARYFSAEELAMMESFVMGDVSENTMRKIGKLSPNGNGLMTALNVYAATIDPALLAVTAAGTVAKESADKSAMRGSEALLDALSTGVIKPPRPQIDTSRLAVGSGVAPSAIPYP